MQPIGKYIIVDPIKEEVKRESGLIVSVQEKEDMRHQKAEVLYVGTAVEKISPGDIIFYDKTSTFSMIVNGSNVTVIKEQQVVVVL